MQKTLTDLLKERLSAPGEKYNDLIDQIIEELQSENPVIDVNFAIDVLSALLFASFATLSSTLAVGFKFLTDNQKVVKELKVCPLYSTNIILFSKTRIPVCFIRKVTAGEALTLQVTCLF